MISPVLDLIIRIKNGYMARAELVESPHSLYREEVLKKLKSLKFIEDYKVTKDRFKNVTIQLLYKDGEPALSGLKLYSKPGRRWYVTTKKLKSNLAGLGYGILSTPKGILTHYEADKQKAGGELLFEIW